MADESAMPRVLMLDDGTEHIFMGQAVVLPSVVIAATTGDITINLERGGYNASGRLLQLARSASADDYDYVVIGNNLGLGITLARMLSKELRPKTLIVWNDPPTDVDTWEYRELGYEHFDTRVKVGRWYNNQVLESRTT